MKQIEHAISLQGMDGVSLSSKFTELKIYVSQVIMTEICNYRIKNYCNQQELLWLVL